MTKLNRKKVREAIKRSYGIKNNIAIACDVARGTVTKFFQKEKNKDLLLQLEQQGERLLDMAENQMALKIAKGDSKMIKFILETRGRKRDYVKKQELETSGMIGIKGYQNVSPDNWDNLNGTVGPCTVPV